GQEGGARTVPDPALCGQREFDPRVLRAGDPDVGRGEQDIEPGAGGPAIDRGNDRLPHPRVVIAHAAVDPGLLSVHRAGERPEDALGAQVFALFLGDVLAWRQGWTAAEISV